MPDPSVMVFWLDPSGTQQGPEPFSAVLERAAAGQLPDSTLLWWDGQADWAPLSSLATTTAAGDAPRPAPPPGPSGAAAAAPMSASQALMSGLSDQELDDEFIALVGRSWEMYKETEFATSIDEAMLGGVITALVDCGFVLIDLETAGALYGVATTTTTASAPATAGVDVGSTATAGHHQLRFEEPETQARVTVAIKHLTPDVATAKMIGQRATAIIGYGERIRDFQKVSQALRQEVQSTFVVSPEPGTVTFDADLSSSYVYAQIDLLLELDRYVADDLAVDHELLRRHIASVIYTMKTFIQSRFGS